MKLTYKIMLLVISVLLVVAITLGTSYSMWKKVVVQEGENTIESSCFKIEFTEASNINLTNAMPVSDDVGLTKTPYVFTIKNTCDIASKATIALNVKKTSTMSTGAIKYFFKSNDTTDTGTKGLITSLTSATISADDTTTKESYLLKSDYVEAGGSKTYTLNLWMDESASNTEMSKVFNAKVSVINEATKSNTSN